jgi:hypothetical protein
MNSPVFHVNNARSNGTVELTKKLLLSTGYLQPAALKSYDQSSIVCSAEIQYIFI